MIAGTIPLCRHPPLVECILPILLNYLLLKCCGSQLLLSLTIIIAYIALRSTILQQLLLLHFQTKQIIGQRLIMSTLHLPASIVVILLSDYQALIALQLLLLDTLCILRICIKSYFFCLNFIIKLRLDYRAHYVCPRQCQTFFVFHITQATIYFYLICQSYYSTKIVVMAILRLGFDCCCCSCMLTMHTLHHLRVKVLINLGGLVVKALIIFCCIY